jgi:hypothetical protein
MVPNKTTSTAMGVVVPPLVIDVDGERISSESGGALYAIRHAGILATLWRRSGHMLFALAVT